MAHVDITAEAVLDIQERPAVLIDEQYQIVAANVAYREAYGISNDALVGRRCYEVSHRTALPCHLNGEDCPHKKVFATGHRYEVLHAHYDAAGSVEHVRICGSLL